MNDKFKRFEERDRKSKKKILKLPCGDGSVVLKHTGDQVVTCMRCKHRWLLHWSILDEYKKLQEIERMI